MMDSPLNDPATNRDLGEVLSGDGMSPAHEPYRSSRGGRLLRGTLSVAGGVAYLFLNLIASIVIGMSTTLLVGVAVWCTGFFITFRWFARDVPLHEERGSQERLKRGVWFASPFVVASLAVVLLASVSPQALRDFQLGPLSHVALCIGSFAPVAFGIGAMTRR